MAKGNDGNYLQHSIEVALGAWLVSRTGVPRLHIALTHGMAPYEATDSLPSGQTSKLLRAALRRSQQPRSDGEPVVVSAYRVAGATLQRYPNSGELLAALIGRDRLCGGIAETNREKQAALSAIWSGSRVRIGSGSWRTEVGAGGVLACPESLCMPWLFASDPMTYHEEGSGDDDRLHGDDVDRLSQALAQFVETGQPGAACLFVYAVRPAIRPRFWAFADAIAERIGVDLTSAWVTHQGGNRNLAAILSAGATFGPHALPEGLCYGR